MHKILDLHWNFYHELHSGKNTSIYDNLHSKNIRILKGFIEEYSLVKRFYQQYYSDVGSPRVVLCGINPGRKGAGKTGVPFLDFKSLSYLLPEDTNSEDEERSAQFIYEIISHFGSRAFFQSVYLTNVSWFGFETGVGSNIRNINYYELDRDLQEFFTKSFIEEMQHVKPKIIIPLSRQVAETLCHMKKQGKFEYPISEPLGHPYYLSFPSRRPQGLSEYKNKITDNILPFQL